MASLDCTLDFGSTLVRLWTPYKSRFVGSQILSVRDTIGSAIYFSTYESTKQMLVRLQGSNSPVSPLSVALAGGFCGLASVTCVGSQGC